MVSIDPTTQTERENYKLLIGSIIPRPIAFVTSQSTAGVMNGAPFSFFNIVSSNPPMIAVSVARRAGEMKDTAKNVSDTKEFVVHLVDESNVTQINETAATLSPDVDELELNGLETTSSTVVNVPGIVKAKVRMECQLAHQIELEGNADLLIGKVVYFHFNDEIYEAGKINAEKLGAISRLAGNDYAKVGEVFTIVRPK